MAGPTSTPVTLLDYGAGNVRSIRNAVTALGYSIREVASVEDISNASVLLFPGVGAFGSAAETLERSGFAEPLNKYLAADRPFMGICIGMQMLFEGSEESPGSRGLSVIPGQVRRFSSSSSGGPERLAVPHMGWNGLQRRAGLPADSPLAHLSDSDRAYFVHSYRAEVTDANRVWVAAETSYGGQFCAAVERGNVFGTQFHPEKSGSVGLSVLDAFLRKHCGAPPSRAPPAIVRSDAALRADAARSLARRVIAALDVRSNDDGDLVVTKGDQYDVREAAAPETGDGSKGRVRNLGKPMLLAERYYGQGADEIVFLNITSFRQGVLEDAPMLSLLEAASERIHVPLCVGGGIRTYTDPESGRMWSALEVAARYFRAGADKVSIGSDAVDAAERLRETGAPDGSTSIEEISRVYGAQAVTVSIDPKRVWLARREDCPAYATVVEREGGPSGESLCWYQATVKGGREARPCCAIEVARASQALGAGEIMLNCIDQDGQGGGYDLALVGAVTSAVTLPVIASSGAGVPAHFVDAFGARADAALAAGMFHRNEFTVAQVKEAIHAAGVPVRMAV